VLNFLNFSWGRIEALMGVECEEGMSPSPLGEGSGEGAVPSSPENFVVLTSKW